MVSFTARAYISLRFIAVERNTHQVPKDVIEARLRQFSPLIPFYFGLFLNEEQTHFVLARAKDFYQQAVTTFPQLRKDLEQISREKSNVRILRH